LDSGFKLEKILPIARKFETKLKRMNETIRVSIAGSIRRKKKTVYDIDLIASSKTPAVVIQKFLKFKEIKKVLASGDTKASVVLSNPKVQVDLRVVKDSSYGAALQYFTGPRTFNIIIRTLAKKKGMKLNEYGLFDRKTGKKLAGKHEKDIFKKLGLPYFTPEELEKKFSKE